MLITGTHTLRRSAASLLGGYASFGMGASFKARNLAGPHPTVRIDAQAADAASILIRHDQRAVLVLDASDRLVAVLSDSMLLRALLPRYVAEDEVLARVVGDEASEILWRRLDGKTVADLIPDDQATTPLVNGEAQLVEVATVMVRSHSPLVGVIDDGRLVGGISLDHLLSHLLRR
jgi:CBS domain-containing protein